MTLLNIKNERLNNPTERKQAIDFLIREISHVLKDCIDIKSYMQSFRRHITEKKLKDLSRYTFELTDIRMYQDLCGYPDFWLDFKIKETVEDVINTDKFYEIMDDIIENIPEKWKAEGYKYLDTIGSSEFTAFEDLKANYDDFSTHGINNNYVTRKYGENYLKNLDDDMMYNMKEIDISGDVSLNERMVCDIMYDDYNIEYALIEEVVDFIEPEYNKMREYCLQLFYDN